MDGRKKLHNGEFLNRYCGFLSLLDILNRKKITLLSPERWNDKNDAWGMIEYQKRRNLQTLVALCFCGVRERSHHWSVFARGEDGVCIEFEKSGLLRSFVGHDGVRHNQVQYKSLKDLRNLTSSEIGIDSDGLPFLKRIQYKDEAEYRIMLESSVALENHEFDIDLGSINLVTLSPWLPKALVPVAEGIIRGFAVVSRVFRKLVFG